MCKVVQVTLGQCLGQINTQGNLGLKDSNPNLLHASFKSATPAYDDASSYKVCQHLVTNSSIGMERGGTEVWYNYSTSDVVNIYFLAEPVS